MFKRDGMRTVFVVAVLAVFLIAGNAIADNSYQVVAFSVGVVLMLAGLSHITRRVLFHRLDLQDIGIKATETPLGAAVVFAAIVYFLTVLVQAGVGMMG